jgi:ubiquinone/menaquinone biosynthesis C-methylase UbiE
MVVSTNDHEHGKVNKISISMPSACGFAAEFSPGRTTLADTEKTQRTRRLTDTLPDLPSKAHDSFVDNLQARADATSDLNRVMAYLDRLIDVSAGGRWLVIGCGPRPETIAYLLRRGCDAYGIEPVPSFVQAANEFLGEPRVMLGVAEALPLKDGSQRVVFIESVLEHVESPLICLGEIYRVLEPGGVTHLTTTNRHRLNLRGNNGEFTTRFYNHFPRLLKESYIHQQLHYRPGLANYTERPAVHWFSYADLCSLGRQAGFARFYSLLDLTREDEPHIARSRARRFVLQQLRRSALLRTIVLTQRGGQIFMWKRHRASRPQDA